MNLVILVLNAIILAAEFEKCLQALKSQKERKKEKLRTPPLDQDMEASNLSRSTPTFPRSSSSEASSSSRSPSIEVITTTCEGTAYTAPSTLSDLTQSEGTPLNESQAGHLLSNILAQNERLEDIVAQNKRLEVIDSATDSAFQAWDEIDESPRWRGRVTRYD
jgi:hypothetical protein